MTRPTRVMLSRREALAALLASGGATLTHAALPSPQPSPAVAGEGAESIVLWPGGAPGGERVTVVEEVVERPHPQGLRDRVARGVRVPTLTAFLPAGAPRAAMLVIPGGGYRHVVIDKEGYETAQWLAQRGIAAYVLRYRLPGDGWAAGPDAPLQDAQRALRLVRHRATKLGLGPHAAVLGFSAGGHLAARLATRFAERSYEARDEYDALSSRPDAAALLYAVITLSGEGVHAGSRDFLLGPAPSPDKPERWSAQNGVTEGAPPTFIVHAADDASVPLRNGLLMYEALRRSGVPTDLHVFARGGHGFGLRAIAGLPVAAWPTLLVDWLAHQPGFTAAPRA